MAIVTAERILSKTFPLICHNVGGISPDFNGHSEKIQSVNNPAATSSRKLCSQVSRTLPKTLALHPTDGMAVTAVAVTPEADGFAIF